MTASLDAAVAAFAPRLPLAVAYSGGADSTALLVACATRWPGQVVAIHVNHGLQAAAAGFESHCRSACGALGVPLHAERIDARHAPGESPEDAARRGRYEAIHRAALREGVACVALAQHADDQVETVLLALSRGAGIAGLAGMRPAWEQDGVDYCRPLLEVSAADIRVWLKARGVEWIEDPSNESEAYTRNRIRSRVLPALREAFPTALNTFARSARHAAQAQSVLEEVAAEDLQRVGTPPDIAALRSLGRARQANVLRHWLRSAHEAQASTAQLEELQRQVAACATRGHDIRLRVGEGFVQRDGARLVFTPSV
ncbi:tRNA lysidine(34) synthetase TilS [Ramlibacter sp. PS4R-6]|uniref:tRNA lysidine(34) synthetase TilS n=1 Tax=Ramlibacter sp. PS4R-6 TaxID=3133438 RepID=UPI0030ADB36F